jgi:hypothetical protein
VDTDVPVAPGSLTGWDNRHVPEVQLTDNSHPADGYLDSADNTPVIKGTAEPGVTVVITDASGSSVCTTQVPATGVWSCETSRLADGKYVFTVTQSDAAGNRSDRSEIRIEIDTVKPGAPDVTGPTDNDGDGSLDTNDEPPSVSGNGEPGDTITIPDPDDPDGPPLCETVVDGNGNWVCTLPPDFPDGNHDLEVVVTDPAGNQDKGDITLNVDHEAPDAPVILVPAHHAEMKALTTISGTGEVGASLVVSATADSRAAAITLCTTKVDANGAWSCQNTVALADGPYRLVAHQTDAAGNESKASNEVSIVIDNVAPSKPDLSDLGEWDNRTGSNVALEDNSKPADGYLDSGDNTPVITGPGTPGSTITIKDGDQVVCTTTVDENGAWSCETDVLPDGDHSLTVTETDKAGNVSEPSDPILIDVDTVAPDAPVITGPTDNNGDGSLDTNDQPPTVSGTGDPGDTITIPDPDNPAGPPLCETVVDPEGNWVCTLPPDFPEGNHDLEVVETDPAGNQDKGDITIDVDHTPPAPPVITGPTDPDGNVGGDINDSTPDFSGEGEPGDTITITDPADPTWPGCSTTVKPDGTGECTPTVPLPDGPHDVNVNEKDHAGNESDSKVDVNVDTEAPSAVAFVSPFGESAAKPALLNTASFAITGTAEGADVVHIYDNGSQDAVDHDDARVLCASIRVVNGQWSCQSARPIEDGVHHLDVVAADRAGNQTVLHDPINKLAHSWTSIDTVKPDDPIITGPSRPDGSVGGDINDSTPDFSGTGDPGDTIHVTDPDDPTWPGCSTVVKPDGTWTCTPDEPLTDGPHDLVVNETDPSGNTSDDSHVNVNVDTEAPDAPVVDDTNGSQITGKGDPGDTIHITDKDGNPLPGCEGVNIDKDGNWGCTPKPPLSDGDHVIVWETDPAGNESEKVVVSVHGIAITLKSTALYITEEQQVTGLNFLAGEKVTGVVHSEPLDLGTIEAAADGTAVFPVFSVPVDFEPGTHTVTLTGAQSGSVSATFEVLDPTINAGGGDDGDGDGGDGNGAGGSGDNVNITTGIPGMVSGSVRTVVGLSLMMGSVLLGAALILGNKRRENEETDLLSVR